MTSADWRQMRVAMRTTTSQLDCRCIRRFWTILSRRSWCKSVAHPSCSSQCGRPRDQTSERVDTRRRKQHVCASDSCSVDASRVAGDRLSMGTLWVLQHQQSTLSQQRASHHREQGTTRRRLSARVGTQFWTRRCTERRIRHSASVWRVKTS